MKRENYAFIGGGSLCCFFAVFFAYLTSWLDWNKAVHHSLAALIAVAGLFLIWYGLHKGYYERLLDKAVRSLEETNPGIDKAE